MCVCVCVCTQEWKEMCDKLFPPKQASKAAKFTMDERYKEEGSWYDRQACSISVSMHGQAVLR